ncbi:MAG TPA: hypothetical protein VI750_13875 [Pyrinomonadaceae bacterium]|nr:hypothetical protein [Pyrinomonadaceae bacterium]
MAETDAKWIDSISRKLNVLLSLQLRILLNDKEFGAKRRKGAADMVSYLASFGLDAKDIADIIGSPVTSVRTLMTPTRRKV